MENLKQKNQPVEKHPFEAILPLYSSQLSEVDRKITQISSSRVALIGQLISHMITSGGKRLRPVLVLLASKLCGNETPYHINMAACVELLHSATLFHDDVVDSSKLRRGRKTANELWGNSASILVGDFLLAQSFILMAETGSLDIINILSRTSSIITEGEVKQLVHKSDITISYDDYIEIISSKTAELFAACCETGAILGNKGKQEREALSNFGRYLGIAFQIADDALDYSANVKKLGKKTGDDFREGKATLPIIHTYLNSTEEEKKYLENLFTSSAKTRGAAQFKSVRSMIAEKDSLQYTLKESEKFVEKAKASLAIFPESDYKTAMLQILDFCINRNY